MSVEIEQAIARGLTATAIAEQLGVDIAHVHEVWDRLDELAVESAVRCGMFASTGHGDHAGFNRHLRRGDQPCAACRVGERIYNTGRKRIRRDTLAGAA